MAKDKEKKVKKKKEHHLIKEFAEFMNKGNAFMLAVGVVIGSAFTSVVNGVTNILLSLATWAVPGGLSGLVTVLPALTSTQQGFAGVGQKFASSDLTSVVIDYAASQGYTAEVGDSLYTYYYNELMSNYTLYGKTYVFNSSAVIDWGTLLNAVISFLIVGIVLFAIVKAVNYISKVNAELKAKAQEEYYQKHPEERPVVEEAAPAAPVETELDVLKEIRDSLAAQNSSK